MWNWAVRKKGLYRPKNHGRLFDEFQSLLECINRQIPTSGERSTVLHYVYDFVNDFVHDFVLFHLLLQAVYFRQLILNNVFTVFGFFADTAEKGPFKIAPQ